MEESKFDQMLEAITEFPACKTREEVIGTAKAFNDGCGSLNEYQKENLNRKFISVLLSTYHANQRTRIYEGIHAINEIVTNVNVVRSVTKDLLSANGVFLQTLCQSPRFHQMQTLWLQINLGLCAFNKKQQLVKCDSALSVQMFKTFTIDQIKQLMQNDGIKIKYDDEMYQLTNQYARYVNKRDAEGKFIAKANAAAAVQSQFQAQYCRNMSEEKEIVCRRNNAWTRQCDDTGVHGNVVDEQVVPAKKEETEEEQKYDDIE